MGPGAVTFLAEHRDEIAPGVPLVFGAVREQSLKAQGIPADVMWVISHFDLEGSVELARRLQPDTKRIVVFWLSRLALGVQNSV